MPQQGAGDADADPYLQVEHVVDRLSRLLLGAQALADRPRATARPDGRSEGDTARTDRLQAGIVLARRALASAVVLDLDTLDRPRVERRQRDRRA